MCCITLVRVSAAYALGRNPDLNPSSTSKFLPEFSIVDFLISKLNDEWNGYVRKGIVWTLGNYKDSKSRVIGDVYPTSTYHIKDNKLFTLDNKQIKVFHYAEALGVKTKEEYNETLYEMKTLWFNKETKEFLKEQCNMNF
jgi:hypothetical protein